MTALLVFFSIWMLASGLFLPLALRFMRFAGTHPAGRERLPAPPRVPADMNTLEHELRLLDRAGW